MFLKNYEMPFWGVNRNEQIGAWGGMSNNENVPFIGNVLNGCFYTRIWYSV